MDALEHQQRSSLDKYTDRGSCRRCHAWQSRGRHCLHQWRPLELSCRRWLSCCQCRCQHFCLHQLMCPWRRLRFDLNAAPSQRHLLNLSESCQVPVCGSQRCLAAFCRAFICSCVTAMPEASSPSEVSINNVHFSLHLFVGLRCGSRQHWHSVVIGVAHEDAPITSTRGHACAQITSPHQ